MCKLAVRIEKMKLFARMVAAVLATSLLASAGIALAHGDTERPLYVAEGGTDSGDCLDSSTPCGTIGYALRMTGKGGQIQVATGTYEIDNAEDVFHLVSGVIQISGGVSLDSKAAMTERGASTLIGVPFQYRELLEKSGFRVVADQKGIDNAKALEASRLLGIYQSLKSSIVATPCVDGSAAGLPCSNVDLLTHVGFVDVSSAPSGGNDIWGFVDLNTGREYAIAGFNLGTAVFDVTDATNPREVGFVDGQSATWRDIKVYQFFDVAADRWKAYAYVTTDGSTDGLFVIDLTGLPHSIRRVSYSSDISSAHNVYATNTDYSTGISLTGDTPTLIIAGSSSDNGRYRSYSLANPESPDFISGGNGTGYMHDASSLIVTDARKDTQCANGGAYCEVLLDFNENTFEIWDVTNAASPVQLSSTPYPNVGYVHSGWWSEDKQFLFVHDELDERDFNLPTTLRTFSVTDLRAPVLAGSWTGPTRAIDHNGFVRGNRYYMSNYTRGLTVLDITNPASPTSVGRIDTYPASDATGFSGAWGAYPFFYSGNIAISDINSGFYMAADQTRDVAEGQLRFQSASSAAVEGQQAQLNVQRVGGSTGSVNVDYEILHATAGIADYSVASGLLTWNAGDGANKSIDINATNDGVSERMERLIVRLISPAGGATLGNLSTASLYLSDPGTQANVSFAAATIAVAERGFGTIVVVVKRSGSATGAASVDFSMTGGNATAGSDFQGATSGTINWADGDGDAKLLEFVINDDGVVESDETLELTLSNPVGMIISGSLTVTATIRDGDGSNEAPNAIAGASQTRASGSQVSLVGNLSSDPDGDVLTYQWSQTSGQNVTLSNAGSAIASFTAPTVTSDTMLQFQLVVSDPGGLSDAAVTTVTVTKPGGGTSGGGSGGGSVAWFLLLLLGGGTLRRRISQKDAV